MEWSNASTGNSRRHSSRTTPPMLGPISYPWFYLESVRPSKRISSAHLSNSFTVHLWNYQESFQHRTTPTRRSDTPVSRIVLESKCKISNLVSLDSSISKHLTSRKTWLLHLRYSSGSTPTSRYYIYHTRAHLMSKNAIGNISSSERTDETTQFQSTGSSQRFFPRHRLPPTQPQHHEHHSTKQQDQPSTQQHLQLNSKQALDEEFIGPRDSQTTRPNLSFASLLSGGGVL